MSTWKQVTTGPKYINLNTQGRAYTRYNHWFYPSTTYGENYQQFNYTTSSATKLTTWTTDKHPQFISPVDGTFKSYGIYGNCSSTNADFEFVLLRGTPNWSNSATATTLTQVGAVLASTWTRNRANKLEHNDPVHYNVFGLPSVNTATVTKGDIIIPAFRRTSTSTSSGYNFFEVSINITLEFE